MKDYYAYSRVAAARRPGQELAVTGVGGTGLES